MSEQNSPLPLSKIGLVLAIACALAILLSVFGYRMELWNHRMTFNVITWGVYGGIGAGALSIVGLFVARGAKGNASLAVMGIFVSALVVLVPYAHDKMMDRKIHPRIHDITTDTVNPPQFVAIIKWRQAAKKKNPQRVKNKLKYGGPKVVMLQKKHHPNLTTAKYPLSADKAFQVTLDLVKKMGWRIAAAVPAEGRIEATASTFWLGFKDDVVFRIKQVGKETHVDMRSTSRFGRGDRGENARRIKAFLKELNIKLG